MAWSDWKTLNYNGYTYENHEVRVCYESGETEIRTKHKLRLLKIKKTNKKRLVVNTYNYEKQRTETMYVHRVIACTFLEYNKEKLNLDVAHKDGNTLNNSPNNLYFATKEENKSDNKKNRVNTGKNHVNSNFESEEIVLVLRECIKLCDNIFYNYPDQKNFKINQSKLAKDLKVTPGIINAIKTRKTWSHIEESNEYNRYKYLFNLIENKIMKHLEDYNKLQKQKKYLEHRNKELEKERKKVKNFIKKI